MGEDHVMSQMGKSFPRGKNMPARGHTFFGENFPHFPQKSMPAGKSFPKTMKNIPVEQGGTALAPHELPSTE